MRLPLLLSALGILAAGCGGGVTSTSQAVVSTKLPVPVGAISLGADKQNSVTIAVDDGPTEPLGQEENAKEAMEKLRGEVKIDDKRPGRPVVKVTLSFRDIKDGDLAFVKDFTRLKELHLDGTKVSDAALAQLKDLPLETLILSDTPLTNAGLEHLKRMSKLQNLVLDRTFVTDAGMIHLQALPRLQTLSLISTNVGDGGLANLKGCKSLTKLYLSGTKVTDGGLPNLDGMVQLQELNLRDTKVTDEGLALLKNLTKLRILNLMDTGITDKGVEKLKGLPNLTHLDLRGTKVTEMGKDDLKKVLTKVVFE